MVRATPFFILAAAAAIAKHALAVPTATTAEAAAVTKFKDCLAKCFTECDRDVIHMHRDEPHQLKCVARDCITSCTGPLPRIAAPIIVPGWGPQSSWTSGWDAEPSFSKTTIINNYFPPAPAAAAATYPTGTGTAGTGPTGGALMNPTGTTPTGRWRNPFPQPTDSAHAGPVELSAVCGKTPDRVDDAYNMKNYYFFDDMIEVLVHRDLPRD
ncbi:hypothetical protein B0H63DRAFT_512786 [Podospora didyma]|uniref:Uncharacterized protein n=1 Tax=Podospora didyma TaxID=330526 RepID=A0AAE0N8G8_9PEZI|nr:hypothetical protein B0H63DRAFT_512786 [Podospora didyma]